VPGGLQLFQNGPTAVRQLRRRGIMFTRPQTQAGPRAVARILIASRSRAVALALTGNQIPVPDCSGQASAGSNDRAEAGLRHELLAGRPEMITSWLLLHRHGFLPRRPAPDRFRRHDHPAEAAERSPQTTDPCL
jgi:hypothetical protein